MVYSDQRGQSVTRTFYVRDDATKELARMEILSRLAEKNSRYDIVGEVENFPSLHYFGNHVVWCGNFSRSAPTMKQRFILKQSSVKDVIHQVTMTPTDAARYYLAYRFPKQLKARMVQIEHWKPRRHQPMLALPDIYRDMVYLDLKSAYWSILQVVGWDVEYFPDMIVRGQDVNDFPYPENKIARNSLVSLGLPTPAFVWQNGTIKEVNTKKTVNLSLWTVVQDILAAIANEMWELGAVYINTDGYILPASKEHEAIARIGEWGLHSEVKHRGKCKVYGVGAYTIGNHVAKLPYRLNAATVDVNPVDVKFLKREFSWLASKFPPVYGNR